MQKQKTQKCCQGSKSRAKRTDGLQCLSDQNCSIYNLNIFTFRGIICTGWAFAWRLLIILRTGCREDCKVSWKMQMWCGTSRQDEKSVVLLSQKCRQNWWLLTFGRTHSMHCNIFVVFAKPTFIWFKITCMAATALLKTPLISYLWMSSDTFVMS